VAFRAHVGSVPIEVDTLDELAAVLERFGGKGKPSQGGPPPAGPERTQIIPSNDPKDAMRKLYLAINNVLHKAMLAVLAAHPAGLTDDELRKKSGLESDKKLSGLSGGIARRCAAYGLKPEDVIIVETLGYTGSKRIYRYRLGPAMLEMMKENGWNRSEAA
jgi:hypothetical protein